MTNKNIDLPSQRVLLMNEIEPALRRKPKVSCNCLLPILFVIVVLCTISYFIVGHIVDEQKARADQTVSAFDKAYYEFCDQAKADHVASGMKESESLTNLCGK